MWTSGIGTKHKIFKEYPRYKKIEKYLDELGNSFPSVIKVVKSGTSYEKRDIKYVHISKNFAEKRNLIFIDAGSHAREWISISTALYCIYLLVELGDYNDELLQTFDWIILPVVNPDGYEYSHDVNRFWRKTRKPTSSMTIGTDCNRNFDFHWEGGCANPKKITYRGDKPFSEPETLIVKDIMERYKDRCKMYISLHSHAKSILYPWGFSKIIPPDWKELNTLAEVGVKAIKEKTGSVYRVGTIARKFHRNICGGSCDYAYGCIKIPYSICFELGGGCFDPSPKLIPQLTKESWIGIRAMAKYTIAKYKCSKPSITKILKRNILEEIRSPEIKRSR